MKTILRNSIAISLAVLVMLSTMSLTFNEHYCGDVLVDSTLFIKAESCGMELKTPTSEERCTVKMKDCCKDVAKLIEGQDNLKIDYSSLDLNQQFFIVSYVYTYLNLFNNLDKESIHLKDYSPPPIVNDVQTFDQVYLI